MRQVRLLVVANLVLEPLEDQAQDGFRRLKHTRRENRQGFQDFYGLGVTVSLPLFRFQTSQQLEPGDALFLEFLEALADVAGT